MSDANKVNKLEDLSIDEVSLVDRGANEHAQVLIHKRHEDEDVGPEDYDENEGVGKADPDPSSLNLEGEEEDGDDELEEALGEKKDKGTVEEKQVGKGFFSRLVEKMFPKELTTDPGGTGTLRDMSDVEKAFPPPQQPQQQMGMFGGQQPPPQMPPQQPPPMQQGAPAPGPQGAMPPGAQGFPAQAQQPGQMQSGPPLPAEVVQYIQQLEQALADAQGEGQGEKPSTGEQEDKNVSPFGKSIDNLDDDEVTFLQELSKNLEDEDTREAIDKALDAVSKANDRAESAEKIAKEERDHRLTQDYIAKARAYVNLPVPAEEFGPVLKRLDETLEEGEMDLVTKALSAANETVATVGAFTEIGKRGGVENFEAVSKVDSAAKELVEKNEDLSMEQARERVFEENPSLYDEYLQESGR